MIRTTNGFTARYNRDSVERALIHHFGGQPTWQRRGAGYSISTSRGILVTTSLRETYVLVVGCAATESRMERKAAGHNG
jgi:hypothetical protein